jgi:hypothetical protein
MPFFLIEVAICSLVRWPFVEYQYFDLLCVCVCVFVCVCVASHYEPVV